MESNEGSNWSATFFSVLADLVGELTVELG